MTLLELYALAAEKDIDVDAFPLASREALSYMDEDGACFVALDPFSLRSAAEEKTKLAHELGHCVRRAFYSARSPLDFRGRQENRADKWAIRRLVPRAELAAAVAAGHLESWDLAEHFGVTEELICKAIHLYEYGNLAADY